MAPDREARGRLLPALAALAALAFGAWLRLSAPGWDGLAALQPDERFLLFRVSDALRGLEASELSLWRLWFDAAASPLNPRNHDPFYVYGDLPHLLLVTAARLTGTAGWDDLMLLGRSLAGTADALAILAVFLAAARWGGGWCGAAGAFLYAALPIAVQGAHFFTVDPFLAAFAALMLAGLATGGRGGWLAAGAGLGFALACKVSALALAPLFLLAAFREGRRGWRGLLLGGLAAALALRLGAPFHFEGLAAPDPRVLAGWRQLAAMVADFPGAPPQWSWVDRTPVLYPLRDLVLIGFAPGLVLALALGLSRLRRGDHGGAWLGAAMLALTLGPMLLHAAPVLRYALPAAPAAAALGGLAVLARPRWLVIVALVLAGLMGDGVRRLMALPHPRIEASLWIRAHVPEGALIVNETPWDEALPVPVPAPGGNRLWWTFAPAPCQDGHLGLTDPPGPAKAACIARLLAEADLLVESSARMSATIPRVAAHRPMSMAYYRLRDSGALCYEEVARFGHGIPILGLVEIPDAWVQESWSVYTHPTVRLFRRLPCYDAAAVERALLEAAR